MSGTAVVFFAPQKIAAAFRAVRKKWAKAGCAGQTVARPDPRRKRGIVYVQQCFGKMSVSEGLRCAIQYHRPEIGTDFPNVMQGN